MQTYRHYLPGLKLSWSLTTILLVFISTLVQAQPSRKVVEVIVAPQHTDWTYTPGERADFKVQIIRNGLPVTNAKISYEIGLEQMPAEKTGILELKDGTATLEGIRYDKAGFIRCTVSTEVEGKTYRAWGTAGYAPDQIKPVVEMPGDFDEFWTKAKEQLAELPIDAKVTLMPEYCTGQIDVYHVSLQNIATSWRGTSRFYGMLSVPKAPGKYPAILGVPGAGVRAYYRDDRAAEGVIVFKVGIHGIPVNMDPEVYNDL